jgi:hypothetical protein
MLRIDLHIVGSERFENASFAFILINLQYNDQNRGGTALASNEC